MLTCGTSTTADLLSEVNKNTNSRDFLSLKIFQSPTDGGLTEIQTRTVDAGEVYEVRNVSDGELATIYSNAAGTTQIPQNGTSNVSDSDGVVEFFVEGGAYYVEVGTYSSKFRTNVAYHSELEGLDSDDAHPASAISTDNGSNLSSDLNSLASRVKNTSILTASERKDLTPWGELAPVNLLGDSISFGLFSSLSGSSGDANTSNGGGMFYNSYCSILARMIAAEYNTNAYKGFSPNLYEYAGDEDVFQDNGTSGFSIVDNAGIYAESSYSGQAISTVTQGDYREYKVPATFDRIVVWYLSQPNGGELTLTVNGVVEQVIDTSSATVENKRIVVGTNTLSFNAQGNMIVRLSKTDATSDKVSITGIGVTNYQNLKPYDLSYGGSLNQFAAPGRTLRSVSEEVISDVTSGASALIMALGYNDKNINFSGQEAERVIFTQRIDWLIQYCNSNNCPVIVPDFTWNTGPTAFTRTELKRLADETGGTYIPLPEMLSKNGFTSDDYRINTLKMWWDGAHPNRYGQEWIAQQIASFMGLSCKTKTDAIKYHDYWISLDLNDDYKNVITNQNWTCAGYKLNGDHIMVRTQISKTAGGNFADGIHFITTDQKLFRSGIAPPVNLTPFELTKTHEIDNTTCVLKSCATLFATGEITLVRAPGVVKTSMNGACSFEIDKYIM